MPEQEQSTKKTLTGIKALLIECSLALDSVQSGVYQQTEQLEILTEKIMLQTRDISRLLEGQYKEVRPVSFWRHMGQSVVIILSGIGLYFAVGFTFKLIVKLLHQWG